MVHRSLPMPSRPSSKPDTYRQTGKDISPRPVTMKMFPSTDPTFWPFFVCTHYVRTYLSCIQERMTSGLVTMPPIHIVKTAFDTLSRIVTPPTTRSCQLPTSRDEETIELHQMNTAPYSNNHIPFLRSRHSDRSLSFSCLSNPLRAVLLIIICAVILLIVPSLPIHGWSGVYPFLKSIVQKDDSVFGLTYSDAQSKQQPLHHGSDSDADITDHATLNRRLDGSMQEGSIILIADIVALVLFVVVISVTGWALLRKRRSHANSDTPQQNPDARQDDLTASRPQNATNQDGKDGGQEPRNPSLVQIPTPRSSTFRSLRMSMIRTPPRVHRPVTISNPVSVKSTMEWHELDPYPYRGFGSENLQISNTQTQKQNRQSDPGHTMLTRNASGATTLSNANSLRKVVGILKGNVRFSGASYPEEAALSDTTHGILSRQASSSSRVSVSTVISPKNELFCVSEDAPAVPPIPPL